jgi:surfeit locus 1 family protein
VGQATKQTKYNKPPPIDLKKVRTNTGENSREALPKPNKIAGIILLAVPAITFGLGVWQVKRREQKLNLIEFLEKRTKAEPAELPNEINDFASFIKENEYKPFKIKGHFIHSKESILSMRHDITLSNRLPGGLVVTPFVLSSNPNMVVLVNRGYVPYTHFSPTTREKTQIDDEIEITGLLRSSEPLSVFSPKNKPPHEWHHRDIYDMAKELNTAPIYIDAIESTTILGGPRGGQTVIQLRNDHLTYLITWFSLSLLTSVLWWKRFAKAFF